MTDSRISTPKRLLRILLGGAILASAWVAVDLITHSQAASAIELPDVSINDIAPGVTPLVTQVAAIAAPVSDPVGHVVIAIVTPSLAAIVPVVEGVVPPVVPIVTEIVGTLPVAERLVFPSEAAPVSTGEIGVALATSPPPPLPTPVGSTPRDLPAVPTSIDQAGGPAAELSSVILAPPGSVRTTHTAAGGTPPSPTYGFDTTPD